MNIIKEGEDFLPSQKWFLLPKPFIRSLSSLSSTAKIVIFIIHSNYNQTKMRRKKSYGLNLHQNPITFSKSCTSILMVNCDIFPIIKRHFFLSWDCWELSWKTWKANKSVTKPWHGRMLEFIVIALKLFFFSSFVN